MLLVYKEQKFGLNTVIIDHKAYNTREEFDTILVQKSKKVEQILLYWQVL